MKSKNSFRMFKVLSVLSVLSIQMLSPSALAQSLDDKFNAEAGIIELELETAAADSTSVALPILNLNNEVTVTSDETEEETDEVASNETEEETVEIVVVEDEGFGDGMEVSDSETSDETDEVASTETEEETDEVVIVEDLTTDEENRDIATVEDDEIEEELTVEERFGKLDTNLETLTDNKQNLLAELAESTDSREDKVSKIEAHNTSVNMELTLANTLDGELAEDHERKEDVQNIIKFFEDTLIDLESEEIIALLDSDNSTDNVTVIEDEEEEEEVLDTDTDEVVDLAAENDELQQLVCDQRDQISDLTSQIESLRAGVTPYEGMMNSMMQLMMMNQMMMMQSMNQQPLYDRAGTPVDTMGQMMAPMMMMQSMSMGMQNAYLGMMASGSAYGLGANTGQTYNVQGDFYGRDYSMVQNPAALTGQTNTLAMPSQFPYRDFRFGQIVSDNRSRAVDTQAATTSSTEDTSATDEKVSTEGMVN